MHRQRKWASFSGIASLMAIALIVAITVGGAGQVWAASSRDGPQVTNELQLPAPNDKEEYGDGDSDTSGAKASDTSNDATLRSLTLVADGKSVELSPAFDPDIALYTTTIRAEQVTVEATATKDTASIVSFTAADKVEVPESDDDKLTTQVQITAGAITDFSLTVKAEDGVSTKTYYVLAGRTSPEMLPEITIEASRSEYVAGLGALTFTLNRAGDTSSALDVTVDFIQDQAWLSSTSHNVTFSAGTSTTTLLFAGSGFSTDVTQSGTLTATVDSVSSYDTSSATVSVSVISQEGPAITVSFEEAEYTVEEDAGSLGAVLVARAAPGVPYVEEFDVSVSSSGIEASSPGDYLAYSHELTFVPTDFTDVGGSLVGKVAAILTIIDDEIPEGDEQFGLRLSKAPSTPLEVGIMDPSGALCVQICENHYLVTIVDDDDVPTVSVSYEQATYSIVEGGSATIKVVLSENPERQVTVPITVTEQGGACFSDYGGIYDRVEFQPGDTSRTFTIVAVQDFANDDGESVRLGFGELPVGVTVGTYATTTVSIVDDDDGDSELNVGALAAHWTVRSGSDELHPDVVDLNANLFILDTCAGAKSFKIIWAGPGDGRQADRWEAYIATHGGVGDLSYDFRTDQGNPKYTSLYGTVSVDGDSSLSIRVRGWFGTDGLGEWSPAVSLICLEDQE